MENSLTQNCLLTSIKEPPKTPEGSCKYCGFSRPVTGLKEPALICENMAGTSDKFRAVDPAGYCENFDSHGHSPAELAAALAQGAKLIPLSQDKFAIVDAEDYEMLSQYKWHAIKSHRTYYAQGKKNRKTIRMHRLLLNAPRHLIVDHRNHNGLDNRMHNIRLCTYAENAQNRRPCRGSLSRYKGVSWDRNQNCYQAHIQLNGKSIKIGTFKSEIAATKAYDKKARELFGEFAYLNFPEDFGLSRRRSAI